MEITQQLRNRVNVDDVLLSQGPQHYFSSWHVKIPRPALILCHPGAISHHQVLGPLIAPVGWSRLMGQLLCCPSCWAQRTASPRLPLLLIHLLLLSPQPNSGTQCQGDKWAVRLISLHLTRTHTRWKATESAARLRGGGMGCLGGCHHNNRQSTAEVSILVLRLITMSVSFGPVIRRPQAACSRQMACFLLSRKLAKDHNCAWLFYSFLKYWQALECLVFTWYRKSSMPQDPFQTNTILWK